MGKKQPNGLGEQFNKPTAGQVVSAELEDRRSEIIAGYTPLVREFLHDFPSCNPVLVTSADAEEKAAYIGWTINELLLSPSEDVSGIDPQAVLELTVETQRINQQTGKVEVVDFAPVSPYLSSEVRLELENSF